MLEKSIIVSVISKYTRHHQPLDGSSMLWKHMHYESVILSLKAARMELVASARQKPYGEEALNLAIRIIDQELMAEQDRLCGEFF